MYFPSTDGRMKIERTRNINIGTVQFGGIGM